MTVSVADDLAGRRWLPEIETALFRVAQEALTNVQRHSTTKAARVFLVGAGASGHLELVIEDSTGDRTSSDRSVPPLVEGAGIRGMRDRLEALGGTLAVEPRDGGFRVTARVPTGAGPP